MENEEIIENIKIGNKENDNMLLLWENNKRLISFIARKYEMYAEKEDLIQEGFLALYDAANNYNENKGAKFSTYAAYWIKMRMKRYITEKTRNIRIPDKKEQERQSYINFVSDYEKKNGRKPHTDEIAHFLNVTADYTTQIEKCQNMVYIKSTDEYINNQDGEERSIIETIKGQEDENSIITYVENKIMVNKLWAIIKNELEQNEYRIIVFRYGYDYEFQEALEISRNEIMKIHKNAIKKLRKSKKLNAINPTPIYSDEKQAKCYKKIGLENYKITWKSVVEFAAIE